MVFYAIFSLSFVLRLRTVVKTVGVLLLVTCDRLNVKDSIVNRFADFDLLAVLDFLVFDFILQAVYFALVGFHNGGEVLALIHNLFVLFDEVVQFRFGFLDDAFGVFYSGVLVGVDVFQVFDFPAAYNDGQKAYDRQKKYDGK